MLERFSCGGYFKKRGIKLADKLVAGGMGAR